MFGLLEGFAPMHRGIRPVEMRERLEPTVVVHSSQHGITDETVTLFCGPELY